MRVRFGFSRYCRHLVSFLALSTLFTVPVLAQSRDQTLGEFAERIRGDVETDGVGGITVGLVRHGELVWAEGFGWADRDKKIAAEPETIYRVGSISKSFTAVAMMLALEQEALRLDDPVVEYFDAVKNFTDLPNGVPDITFRQLASHTAGLIREPRLQGAASGPIEEWEGKILESIPATGYQSTPGTEYSYSNIGYGVLGLAVSEAASAPFMDYVTGRIFRTLGMASSTFIIGSDLRANLATGYSNGRDGTINAEQPAREHDGRGYKVPNGGIYSTVGDLGRFIGAMTGVDGLEILSTASRSEMQRVQTPEPNESGYGLGFSIRVNDQGRKLIGHGGAVSGYTAHLLFEPESGWGVVILRNYNRGQTNLGAAAADLLTAVLEVERFPGSPGPH